MEEHISVQTQDPSVQGSRGPRVQACGFRAHRVNPAEDEAGGPVGIAQAFNVIINNSIFMVLSDICQ